MLLLTKRGADDAKPIHALYAQTISILSTLHGSHRERRVGSSSFQLQHVPNKTTMRAIHFWAQKCLNQVFNPFMLLLRLIQVLGLGARGFWSWQLAYRNSGRNRKICQEHRQMLTSNWSSIHLIVNAGKTTIRQKSGHCAIAIRSVQIKKKRAVKEIIAHRRKDHYGKKELQSTRPEPVTHEKNSNSQVTHGISNQS
jgi:hypothetical protein